MSQWSDFYAGRVGKGYADYCKRRYAQFLAYLTSCDKSTTFREEGCGIGTISRILLENNFYNLELFDLDPEQVELAKTYTHNSVPVYQGNILAYHQPVDVIFSHGVIEHFSDEQIECILNRQLVVANHRVVHYVPTDGYDTPTFGDERLMPVEWWVDKFNPTEWHTFNDGKDLVLIWEKRL